MILWVVYLSVFVDHLTVPTYNNYLQFIFPDEDQGSLMKTLIFCSGVSFFSSCMVQSWSLERFGKKYMREIISMNLFINGLCVLIFSFLPVRGVVAYTLWIPLRILANILSSELYAPFVIQKLYPEDEKKRFFANSGTLAFQCLGYVAAVIMPLVNLKGRLAFRVSSSIGLASSVLCYFALRSTKFSTKHIKLLDDEIIEATTDEIQKSSTTDEEKSGHAKISKIFCDPYWLVTAAFILFRISMSGFIAYNIFVRVKSLYNLDVGAVSIVQLILSVANVAGGLAASLPLTKIPHNDWKLGILTILSAILCFLYDTIESSGLEGVVVLGSCYWILDFCISVPTLMRVSRYSSRQHPKIATKILTGTLSISYIGGIYGSVLASLEIPAVCYTIESIVILLSILIMVLSRSE